MNKKEDEEEIIINSKLTEIECSNEINKNLLINKYLCFTRTQDWKIKKKKKESSLKSNVAEKSILKQIQSEKNLLKQNLEKTNNWLSFNGNVLNKLIVGLGDVSIDETGITLHHIYGIPYIPGSAIKGILKNYMIEKYFFDEKDKEDIERKANNDCLFKVVFGMSESKENAQGKIIFFDAYPDCEYSIGLDVMAAHHSKYYSGKKIQSDDKNKFPLDTDDVEPHLFYVVESGTTFRFDLAVSKSVESKVEVMKENSVCSNELKKYDDFGTFILADLIEALICHGIGAKTAVGYGYFDLDKEQELKKYKNLVEKNKKEYDDFMKKKQEEMNQKIQDENKRIEYEEAIKGKTHIEIEIYKIDKLDEAKQHDAIINLYQEIEKGNNLSKEEQIKAAEYIKNYYMKEGEWKIKKKSDKKTQRVKRICEILGEDFSV